MIGLIRIPMICGMGFLIGGLGVYYMHSWGQPRYKQPMFWGSISATLFIVIAMVSELGHIGEATTWKTIAGYIATAAGLYSLWLGVKYRAKHGRG